jgi:hypothetical protein
MGRPSKKHFSGDDVKRNKILTLTQNFIPYVKELRGLKLVKSTNACLLMQQLDYWFERKPQGFYKFLSPCEAIGYKQGDSWCEELGISADEFRNAFDQIGVRYKSKKEYNEADNKFLSINKATGEVEEKYYCSYLDKIRRQTFYFRNQVVVDSALDSIPSTGVGEAAYEVGKTGSGDKQKQATESGESKPDYTETTTQTTPKITQEREELAYASSHSGNIYEGNSDSSLESSSSSHTEPAGAKIPAAPVPEDFQPTRDMLYWAACELPRISAKAATEKFINHYRATGKTLKDWSAQWRKWMRDEAEYKRRNNDDSVDDNAIEEVFLNTYGLEEEVSSYLAYDSENFVVHRGEIKAAFSDLTETTLTRVLSEIIKDGTVASPVENYYYSQYRYDDDAEYKEGVDRWQAARGLNPSKAA